MPLIIFALLITPLSPRISIFARFSPADIADDDITYAAIAAAGQLSAIFR
jgi:hypothetical protein